jgi:hypothetical protein
MLPSNYTLILEQFFEVSQRFPDLRLKNVNGLPVLKGILDIPDDNKVRIGSFSIEINFTDSFPSRFPILFEVGGDIPSEADWHKYSNNSCCITVEPNEILICKNGITILSFIEKYVVPYFANQIYKKRFGEYKNGEYSHGIEGLRQFYSDLFKTTTAKKWTEYFEIVFNNAPNRISRNDKCFCGSDVKFKKCHDLVFHQMRLLGKEQINKDLIKILNET